MFREVCHRLPKLNECLSASNLLVALKWVSQVSIDCVEIASPQLKLLLAINCKQDLRSLCPGKVRLDLTIYSMINLTGLLLLFSLKIYSLSCPAHVAPMLSCSLGCSDDPATHVFSQIGIHVGG